jgi:hypothetical protein
MGEAEWLTCTDPTPMLQHLDRAASHRKERLFVVACIERIWPLLTDARSRSAVAALRRSTDGRAGKRDAQTAVTDSDRPAGEGGHQEQAQRREKRVSSSFPPPGPDRVPAHSSPAVVSAFTCP